MGCNAQSKENFWSPVPIAHVFRIVQASAAPQPASASESDPEDEGEDDEIVEYKPVSHPRSDVKGNLANQPKKTDYFRVDSN